ncbi:short-chain dehydrogenase [Thiosulfatimonas sediminis]|uniref:Short-chain dehydrogenase n=1 Tax=Thiosulfatimonas sediminis TaxID=2675054 RepID=A0A6F8PS70_9GAMM|nr:dihydromonapterin reductase [Thiosulfatimonas sediminis]BBP44973.1 short-chain dehydrogenase [Thiosulfatimonas sediminis]
MAQFQQAVLITGAGQRVGLHLAQAFLAQGKYPVLITYRKPRAEINDLVAKGAKAYQVDFNDATQLQQFIDQVQQDVVSLRALIHNASIWVTDAQIAADPTLYDALFAVHVKAPYQLTMGLQSLLFKCEGGSDVIGFSDASAQLNRSDYIAYLSSKAALQNQLRQFAAKLAPHCKVNDIAPGLLMFHAEDTAAMRAKRLARQLLPFEPGPEVIWQSVQFLMNNAYVTGVSLPVDGGVGIK